MSLGKLSDQFQTNPPKGAKILKLVVWIIVIVLLVIGVGVVIRKNKISASETRAAFDEHVKESREKAYQEKYDHIYQISYGVSERSNHVTNRVLLQVGTIQEMADLEVLEVSGSEFVIEKAADNKEKNEAWLEVIASGVYTVDLTCAEFIFDVEHHHVWVRVPKPVFSRKNFGVIDDSKILFKNEKILGNGSIPGGEELRIKLKQEGAEKIFNELTSNQDYYNSAEESARMLISNLVKECNPEYDNILVEVEFVE